METAQAVILTLCFRLWQGTQENCALFRVARFFSGGRVFAITRDVPKVAKVDDDEFAMFAQLNGVNRA
jgi:hypothetical protein